MSKRIIALDGDGVLLDYHQAYAQAWGRFTGVAPTEIDPLGYWHFDRWNIQKLEGAPLARLRSFFDDDFWASIPALPGAVEACQRLHDAGNVLVCVTAIEQQFAPARQRNLHDLGFPIDRVLATGNLPGPPSPKAPTLQKLRPRVFVDDYLPYMEGIHQDIHRALIMRGPNGTPNTGPMMATVSSTHSDMPAFSEWWLQHGT